MAIAQPHSPDILFWEVLGCHFDNATMQVQSCSVVAPATQHAIVNILESGAETFNKR